jgi:GT2 family glycosyltransferase
MAARKKRTALLALGKLVERGLRRLRHGIRDARAAAVILRAASRSGAATLARLAAGLSPPDVIICGGFDASSATKECLRCLDALSHGPLPPRRVWIVAPADTLAAVRRSTGSGVRSATSRQAPDLCFVEGPSDVGQTHLASLHTAVAAAASGHVLLCDAQATVCEDALLWVAAVLEWNGGCGASREILAIYGDDAAADPSDGPWAAPTIHHKPDFSWTSLLAGSYLGPIVAFKRSLAAAAVERLVARGVATSSAGESLYALALESLRGCSNEDVAHIQHPLAILSRDHVTAAGDDTARIASEALQSVGVSAAVSMHPQEASLHQFELHPRRSAHVSIVIPTKNAGALVKSCVQDLRDSAGYDNYDITVIDHESDEPELLDFLARESEADRLKVFPYRGPFNFAAMNNAAVPSTRGSLLLFLNNDVDGFSPRWLEQLVATFELDDRIGAVGALLHYPEGDIQHAGVVLNAKRLCQHAHYNWPAEALGYQGRIRRLQEFSAVTAALMLVRRDAFEAVGGFDEQFPDDYNDIDLCLRLRRAGLAIVYQPHVQATHKEGRTRTAKETAKDAFIARWQHAFSCDPFYHPHLAVTDFRPDGLGRLWRQRKTVALAELLAGRALEARNQPLVPPPCRGRAA